MNKKDRYLKSLPLQGGGWRKRAAERGRNWSDVTRARREGRRKGGPPKRARGAPKTQWEGECCFFSAVGMKRKKSARKNLQTPQQVERSWSQL
ncbi:hypothetical protein TNCV_304881 [Trichonephila clavipes]|nr:hypothetical protein TNCV_304881 [Trichonephila clavipes]